MWTKIKTWLLSKVQDAATSEIHNLSQYEPVIADYIRKEANPDARAKQVVDLLQSKLTDVVNNAFSAKWLSGVFFGSVKSSLLNEVGTLSNYETDIANLLRRNIDPDAQATLVINYVQDYLTGLVAKYIQKI